MTTRLIGLVCLLWLIPGVSSAATFWTDTFEYASQGAFESTWASSCPGNSTLMGPSTDFAVSPTRSLKSVQNGGLNSCFIDRVFTSTSRVFYRAYFRWSSNFDFETVCHPSGTCPGGNGSKVWYAKSTGGYQAYLFVKPFSRQIRIAVPHGSYSRLCPNGSTDYECVFEPNMSSTAIVPGTTQCVEMELSRGTPGGADGEIRVWIDGTLTVQYTNARIASASEGSTNWNLITYYNQGGYGTRYMDDLAIGDTRIGCGGSSPGDTTAPGVPTITTSASGGGQGNVSWSAVTDNVGVTGYEVLRCTGASCTPSTLLATTSSSTLFYTDLTLAPSTTYRYAVRAFDAAGNRSSPSNLGSVTTTATYKSILASVTHDVANNTDIGAAFDAGYTGQGPCQIVSNRVRPTTVNTRCYETYNATVPGNDQWAQRTISTLTGAQAADQCVLLRAANAATVTSYAGCALVNGSNTYEIREYSAGTIVATTGNATYTVTNADKIRLEAEGTALRLYRIRGTQETLVVSTTDATIASGKAGLSNFVATSGSLANNESDDFVMGDFGAAAAGLVQFDVASNSPNNTTNTVSWTHTAGSQSNRAVIGCAYARGATASTTYVSTFSLGGQPLSFVRRESITAGDGQVFTVEAWRLLGSPSGGQTATITWAGTPSRFATGALVGLYNVDQTAAVDALNGGTGTGTAISDAITTVTDHAAIVDCVVSRGNDSLTVGSGQVERAKFLASPSVVLDWTGASTVLDKSPAGAETMDWTQSAAEEWALASVALVPATVTPVVPPTIASLTPSASGFTVTAGATTPTRMRIAAGSNSGLLSFADNVLWNTTYSNTWPDGYEYVCAYPIDSAGVENTAAGAHKCGSLIGLVNPLDTTPIVMTQTFPTTTLNQGTTSTLFTIAIDKNGSCKWDTSNTTYALMANVMSTGSLSASANTGNILSDGTTTHLYTQCQFENNAGQTITTTTALDVSISVAAGAPTDTTRPSTIADLAATALSQAQVQLVWSAATDANGVPSYNIYLCSTTTTCTPDTFAGGTGNVTQIVLNLSPLTTYCFDVRGVDPSNNEALASNAPCVTTTAIPDIEPPSTMQNFRVVGGPFAASVILGWDSGNGTPGSVTTTIEQCTGVGCTDFVAVHSNISTQQIQTGLTPGIAYRFRGIFTDAAGNRSLAYSNIVEVLTKTTGIDLPRGEFPFGAVRDIIARDIVPVARPVRP